MTTTLITIAVTVAIVALILYRNLTWQSVNLAKLTRLPIVMGLIGIVTVSATIRSLGSRWHLTLADALVLGIELAVAVLVGWAMGRLSEFRTVDGKVRSRLQPAGAAVFLAFIALRVAVAFGSASIGGTPALMSSSVLLVIAAIKLTQSFVIRQAVAAHSAGRQDEALLAEPIFSRR
jgi:hypothetical protein